MWQSTRLLTVLAIAPEILVAFLGLWVRVKNRAPAHRGSRGSANCVLQASHNSPLQKRKIEILLADLGKKMKRTPPEVRGGKRKKKRERLSVVQRQSYTANSVCAPTPRRVVCTEEESEGKAGIDGKPKKRKPKKRKKCRQLNMPCDIVFRKILSFVD